MIAMTLREIAAVVGGTVTEEASAEVEVTGAAFLDSRQPVDGGLFLAIAGEHVDGHEFAATALAGGAAAVLGSRAVAGPGVVVADVQHAIGLLAAHVLRELRRARADLRVLAVTGSAGKTGVKDMLGAVLATAGATVATFGSFNNELGLPLTVLRAGASTTRWWPRWRRGPAAGC
jgi:UDP-N-acetylmuramoyl-tripeptide--D-alanyl-D-alanine ligase